MSYRYPHQDDSDENGFGEGLQEGSGSQPLLSSSTRQQDEEEEEDDEYHGKSSSNEIYIERASH